MADVSDSTSANVTKNNELRTSKPEMCDKVLSGVSKSNESSNKTSQIKFGSGPLLLGGRNHFPLRSSLLGASLSTVKNSVENSPGKSVPFVLNPPRLANPFAKVEKEDEPPKEEASPTKAGSCGGAAAAGGPAVAFVPLKGDSKPSLPESAAPPAPQPPSLGFVFGENLHERVVGNADCREVKTNGTMTDMLFTAGVKKEATEKTNDSGGKTLSEAAREYEEARAVKRKYEAVTVVTGEEEESNILQMNCKLFAFDKGTANWVERGRGTLRLNDLPGSPVQSRLIVRAAGSLRLVLNTKIWAGMTVTRASLKSLTITAMDSSQVVKVFLIMASPKEIDQLQKALEWRVTASKKHNTSPEESEAGAEERSPEKKSKTADSEEEGKS